MVTRELQLRHKREAQRPPSRYDDYTVPWNDGRTMAELGFKERYRHREFHMPWFRMRRDSLNNRVLYAYWILEHSHKPVDGLIAPTPLATDQAGLADLFGCAEDSVHETTRRTIYWFLQADFLVLANNGFYSYLGGVCKTYYVNRAKLKAWIATLREEGKLPKGCKYIKASWSEKNMTRVAAKVERLAKKSKTIRTWKTRIDDCASKSGPMSIGLVPPSYLSPAEARAYVNHAILSRSNAYLSLQPSLNTYKNLLLTTHSLRTSSLPTPPRTSTIIATVGNAEIAENCQNSHKSRYISRSVDRKNWEIDMLQTRCNFKVQTACNAKITSVSFRAYSKIGLLSSHDKTDHGKWITSYRKRLLDEMFGEGNYARVDRSASIHHLTMCLHSGYYEKNGERDLYSELYRRMYGKSLVLGDRDDFKALMNRFYFTKSDRLFASQLIRTSHEYHAKDKDFLLDFYRRARSAYVGMVGPRLKDDIFQFESLLMVETQIYLLKKYRLRSANVYDELVIENREWRSRRRYTDAELKVLMEEASAAVFPKVLELFHKGTRIDLAA